MAVALHLGAPAHCSGITRDSWSSLASSSSLRRRLGLESSVRLVCGKRERSGGRRGGLEVRCQRGVSAVLEKDEVVREGADGNAAQLSIVMKFGGSSVASADRMKEVADLILSFPEEKPVIVLSAMGKTTNNLLLAGEKAVCCGVTNVSDLEELRTVNELGIERSIISGGFPSSLFACLSIFCFISILFESEISVHHSWDMDNEFLIALRNAIYKMVDDPEIASMCLQEAAYDPYGYGYDASEISSSSGYYPMQPGASYGSDFAAGIFGWAPPQPYHHPKDTSQSQSLLDELEQLLKGIAMMKELTPRTRDYLVSFGECMSTRIFAAYLNKIGTKARQYDAFDIGFITTDDFTNADILEATYPAIAKRLHGDWINDPAIPIVTGFLGKGWKSCAVTTLGRGGSDLTATTIGKALGLREVQVLHPQSMRPARESDIPVRVKNSYNPRAPGTVITRARDMSEAILTSIVLKSNITMLDIVSTRMLGQYGFLAKVFSIFEGLGISVDCVATSEVSISLTLDPSKLWSRELVQQESELDHLVEELEKIAVVHLLQHRSIISLIGNVQRSSLILEKAFNILWKNKVNVQMISQGASKVNISLVVHDSEAKQCVRALHLAFFEDGFLSEVGETDLFQNDSAALPSSC
ncbi:putative aspartokinase 2, chloroplastic [Cocos nucifera]|uniref:aspartate kinase n=1 Tax=Cocos nucifera TaxID=13894 RepID=A0A8K0INK3_COCNU|nr:putative aspartokinase 2, chloroplastic [Cocos nucifera]